MHLELSAASRVLIDLRATGLLRGLAHDPTLVAHPDASGVDVPDDSSADFDAPVSASFRVDAIEVPPELPASDREKMRGNMLGRDVLDSARHPTVTLSGRYRGSLERGHLEGDLNVLGKTHPVNLDVQIKREGSSLVATASWEGRLTDLGIKPYKALLGALRLEDWVRLRVDARLA